VKNWTITKLNLSRGANCAALSTITLFAAQLACADQAEYFVQHKFNINVNAAAGQEFRGIWQWRTFAQARGQDGTATDGSSNKKDFVGASDGNMFADATKAGAFATDTAAFTVDATGSGSHEVGGLAEVDRPAGFYAKASSESQISFNIGTVNAMGRILWGPRWTNSRISGTQSIGRDPVTLSVRDMDTGVLASTTLWDIGLDLGEGGSSTYENGDLKFHGGGHGSFHLEMESPFLTGDQGHMEMSWDGGVVTSSDDSGVFDGLLPTLGGAADLSAHIGDANGNVSLGFDMGGTNVNGYDMGIGFETDGVAEAVPEPGSLAALGLSLASFAGRRRWFGRRGQ